MDETLSICRNCGRELEWSWLHDWRDLEDQLSFCLENGEPHDPEEDLEPAPRGYDAFDMEYDR